MSARTMRAVALLLIVAGAVAALAGAKPARDPAPAAAGATGIADSALGLIRSSVFSAPAPPAVAPNTTAPTERPRLARAYPGAPPRVPHGIDVFLPLTREQHLCLDCHGREVAPETGAVPIPESHYRDLRGAPEVVRDQVAGARRVCVTCHVPVTEAAPLVENRFGKPAAR